MIEFEIKPGISEVDTIRLVGEAKFVAMVSRVRRMKVAGLDKKIDIWLMLQSSRREIRLHV